MSKKVAILGGGIAGMSAAHELIERGFSVEVFERRTMPGGKARSMPTDQDASSTASGEKPSGRPPLPGEHGFRFFPGFYRHVTDTMARIPFGQGSVADNLVDTEQVHMARFGKAPFYYPARFPQRADEWLSAARALFGLLAGELGVETTETAFFIQKIFQIVTSCDERRLAEYEKIDWWSFVEADRHSHHFQNLFANGFTRSLVAAKAERASTRTIGNTFVQMLVSAFSPGISADRVLNGPTNDVWLRPWLDHLSRSGVKYHFDVDVLSLQVRANRIASAQATRHGRPFRIEADYFIAALPVERLVEILPEEACTRDPSLHHLHELSEYVEWMSGIQFYLTEDVPLVRGHSIYMDTPWALTSVSQPQFWPSYDISKHGDGRTKGILSVCISDWDIKGLNGKSAQECSRKEIMLEVWDELKRSLNTCGKQVLRDEMLVHWFLDPAIQDTDPRRPGQETNTEPLLVNYVDTWRLRPEAISKIENFFLASDYVRTHTDIATMEAANEAARRAVNGILVASGSIAAPAEVWPLQEPEFFAPFREYDRVRFDQGLGWDGGPIELAGSLLDGLEGTHLASLPNSDLARSDSEPSKIVPALVLTPNSALPRLATHVDQTVADTVATIASYSVRVVDFNHSNEGPIAEILDGRPVSSINE